MSASVWTARIMCIQIETKTRCFRLSVFYVSAESNRSTNTIWILFYIWMPPPPNECWDCCWCSRYCCWLHTFFSIEWKFHSQLLLEHFWLYSAFMRLVFARCDFQCSMHKKVFKCGHAINERWHRMQVVFVGGGNFHHWIYVRPLENVKGNWANW